jgi:nucleotide-binding universal stress UspA family protein
MHILLATDGSEIALEATRRGLALLADATKVTLLSVVGDIPTDTGGGIEGPIYTPQQEEDLRRSEEHHAAHALADTQAVLGAVLSPTVSIDQRVETGDPAAMICLVARDLGVDVVVVGSHGKGFLSRALLGSVSGHVTRHAPCPVLVVRTPSD